jgi:hypothetical protein
VRATWLVRTDRWSDGPKRLDLKQVGRRSPRSRFGSGDVMIHSITFGAAEGWQRQGDVQLTKLRPLAAPD